MKKRAFIIILVILLIILAISFYFIKKSNNFNNNDSYNSTRTSDSINNYSENSSNQSDFSSNTGSANSSNLSQNTADTYNTSISNVAAGSDNATVSSNSEISKTESSESAETLLSDFSTKIYTKDSKRQNNISITCDTLNNTIINSGDTFSFCDTVGKATSNKGYKKADVYQNGEVIKALGGGNCQVSSTLYNAVLKVSDLKVTERHSHSNSVPYVKSGKDAAVSYGSYDFKFINNTGSNLKITSSTDGSFVYVKIFKIN